MSAKDSLTWQEFRERARQQQKRRRQTAENKTPPNGSTASKDNTPAVRPKTKPELQETLQNQYQPQDLVRQTSSSPRTSKPRRRPWINAKPKSATSRKDVRFKRLPPEQQHPPVPIRAEPEAKPGRPSSVGRQNKPDPKHDRVSPRSSLYYRNLRGRHPNDRRADAARMPQQPHYAKPLKRAIKDGGGNKKRPTPSQKPEVAHDDDASQPVRKPSSTRRAWNYRTKPPRPARTARTHSPAPPAHRRHRGDVDYSTDDDFDYERRRRSRSRVPTYRDDTPPRRPRIDYDEHGRRRRRSRTPDSDRERRYSPRSRRGRDYDSDDGERRRPAYYQRAETFLKDDRRSPSELRRRRHVDDDPDLKAVIPTAGRRSPRLERRTSPAPLRLATPERLPEFDLRSTDVNTDAQRHQNGFRYKRELNRSSRLPNINQRPVVDDVGSLSNSVSTLILSDRDTPQRLEYHKPSTAFVNHVESDDVYLPPIDESEVIIDSLSCVLDDRIQISIMKKRHKTTRLNRQSFWNAKVPSEACSERCGFDSRYRPGRFRRDLILCL